MESENKKRYIIMTIVAMLVVIITGTFAWLTYRTDDTALVLTVGDIGSLRITLSPYQINAKIDPALTYDDEENGNPILTTVTAHNSGAVTKKMRLFYDVHSIDQELAISEFTYTILKSTSSSGSYTEITPNGNFNNVEAGDEVTIYEENIPAGGTYFYQVYIWLDGSEDPTLVSGKKFNAELNAEISEAYTYVYSISGTTASIGQALPAGYVTYDNQADAVSAAVTTMGGPFYLKHKIMDGVVTETYVEAYENGVTYSLRGGVDESSLSEKPIYDSNMLVIGSYSGSLYTQATNNGGVNFRKGVITGWWCSASSAAVSRCYNNEPAVKP